MTKITILDIETTGLNVNKDLIVEIAFVELNLDNGEIKELINTVIKEPEFNKNYYESWIFKENYFKVSEIENAPTLKEKFDFIQSILNNYYTTSFNEKFDFKFLKKCGFNIPKKFPCIMIVSANVIKRSSEIDRYKWPKMEKAYKFFFPEKSFEKTHRALSDANHEAEILYKLYNEGKFVEFEFSNELLEIYNDFASRPYDDKKIGKSFEHYPKNNDEAIKYLKTKFPLHYPKARKIFNALDCLPLACAKISVIDFGCGPFTFTLSFLDEILKKSENYGGGAFEINILGIDKSFYSLTLGLEIINDYKIKINYKGFVINVKTMFDDGNFDDIENTINHWLSSNNSDYIFLGYNASMSSGIFNLTHILKTIFDFSKNINFYAFVIEPNKYRSNIDINELIKTFPDLNINEEMYETSCKKPQYMDSKYKGIYSQYSAIHINNLRNEIKNIIKNSKFKTSREFKIILLNKIKKWLYYERLVDYVGLNLIDFNLKYSFYIINRILPRLTNQTFLNYKIQKGLKPNKYRDFRIINFPYTILSFLILTNIGKKIDTYLDCSILCSRLCEKERIDRIYEFFTEGYTEFSNFELEKGYGEFLICTVDIEDFFNSINKITLKDELIDIFNKLNISSKLIEIIFNCFGISSGIPIGSSLSSLIANLFLSKIDEKIIKHNDVIDYVRYMDDIKIILKRDYEKTAINKFKAFLEETFKIIGLKIKDKKFEIKKIDTNLFIFKLNRIFENLTKEYFDLINPIKYGLGILLYSLKNNNVNVEDHLKDISILISKALERNGIVFNENALLRYSILVHNKLKDSIFMKEIEVILKKDNWDFKIMYDLLEKNEIQISNYFINTNRMWLFRCLQFSKKIYEKCLSEIEKWDALLEDLDLLKSNIDEKRKKEILTHKNEILESEDFLLSIRLIKYLVYRLSRIKYYKLYKGSSKLIEKLIKLINLYFPLKIIGFLLYRYNHIEILKDLLDKSIEPLEMIDGIMTRKIYPNDIAFLIHLLALYYEKKKEDFFNDFEYWIEKINITLFSRPYEEKLAITEFILRLKIINKISYNKWLLWYQQADNLLVLKNILICLAFHDSSPKEIPNELKKKLLENYKYDEILSNISMRLWKEIKLDNNIDIFKINDPFITIKKFPIEIDLDFELKSIFEWDEGFGGNSSY